MSAQPDDDSLTDSLRDALAHLDWRDYTCQCLMHPDGCRNRASFVVAIHAIDCCNKPGVDPYGNRIEILCLWCLATLRVEISERLRRIRAHGLATCEGCGSPLAFVDDVVRGVMPL